MNEREGTHVNSGGGSISLVGSVVGGTGNRATSNAADVTIDAMAATPISRDELLAAFEEIRSAIESAGDLPEQLRSDLEEDLAAARRAIDRGEPDMARAAERLGSMQKIAEASSGIATSAGRIAVLVASAVRFVAGMVA